MIYFYTEARQIALDNLESAGWGDAASKLSKSGFYQRTFRHYDRLMMRQDVLFGYLDNIKENKWQKKYPF